MATVTVAAGSVRSTMRPSPPPPPPPAVAEAVSFAAPDAKYGEEVHAAVVLQGDATVEQIQAHCRERLADFKVPKVIHITRELPRTPTGKVQRRHVAAAFLKS